MRVLFKSQIVVLYCSIAWASLHVHGQTLLNLGFESEPVGTLLNDVPGWVQLTESTGSGRLQIAAESGGNQFLTTQLGNNQAGRYALGFANPGFSSTTTLTLTMDVWDPAVNSQSSVNSHPRALAGVFELVGNSGMPPYVGLEHAGLGQDDIAEWVLAEEGFVDRQFGPTDSVAQDIWYTIQSEWDFSTGTKNLSVKTRDGNDAFVEVLPPSPIGFNDPAQNLANLNALGVRMLRGTRIDNVVVSYDDPILSPPDPFISVAQPRPNVPGAPLPSDVVFSVRSFFSSPSEYPQIAAAFHATRNDWTYSAGNRSAISTLAAQGMTSGAATNPAAHSLPDDSPGLALHWDGVTPLSRHFDTRYNGDVNSEIFRQAVLTKLKRFIDAGQQRVQFDNPRSNTELAVVFGGNFAPASMTKYNLWLEANTTVAERTSLGLPADLTGFDYRVFVENLNGNVSSELFDLSLAFHQESTIEFYDWLKQEISAYAGFNVPFSANNVSGWDVDPDKPATSLPEYIETFRWFDFAIGELRPRDANPLFLHNSVRSAEELGKRQVFTLGGESPDLNRKTLAYSYALGAHMIMPWDVYIANEPRFFGDPNDYNDLTGFVRAHAELYDGYESAADVGPGIIDARVSAWDPLKIDGGSGEVYAFVRAVPDDPSAPLVVHLMDWSDSPQGFSLQLLNEMFLWPSHLAMPAELLLPDGSQVALSGSVDASGYTEVSLSALDPYGLLVVEAYPLTADFDMDGDVDGADLAAWEAGFGTSAGATKAMGDSDLDGDVDGFDFLNWQRQAGQSFSLMPVVTTVPEPSSPMLSITIAAWSLGRRGNKPSSPPESLA